MKKRIFSLLLILGLTTSATVALGQNPITLLTQKMMPSTVGSPTTGAVLAAHDEADATAFETDVRLEVNIPAVFNDSVTINGQFVATSLSSTNFVTESVTANLVTANRLVAPNVVYSLTGTDGLTIAGDQDLTITNTDKGSSQNIFKNFKLGDDTISAGSNSDTIEFAAGTNIGLSLDTGAKKLTISNTFALPTQPWTLTGTNVHLSTSTDYVGIGTTSPSYKLHVAGSTGLSGDVVLGGAITDELIFTARMASGTTLVPIVDLGADLGSSSLRFNNIYAATINTNSTLSTAGQAVFTYEPTSTAYTQASVLINPTAPSANTQLLGIGQGGYQRMLVDAEGDLTLGYNDAISAPASDYPLNIYGHNGTRVSYIDTSGNMTLNGSLTVNGGLSGTNYTQGSVIFQGASGLTQDNSNFFWDDSNNRLGIGTTVPGSQLHLYANDNATLSFTRGVSGAVDNIISSGGLLKFTRTGGVGNINMDTATGRLTIETTAGPCSGGSGAPLRACSGGSAGATWFEGSAAGTNPVVTIKNTNASATGSLTRWLNNNNTVLAYLSATGNLRLGSAAPDEGMLNMTGAFTGKALAILNETGNQDILAASSSGTNRFVITNAGNVGIGTTNPTAKLQVNTGSTTPAIYFGGTSDQNIYFGAASTNFNKIYKSVNSQQLIYDAGYNQAAGYGHVFMVDRSKEVMRMEGNGNVGIGTTTPASLLHVNGKVTGKALSIFNETGDQNIFTASASGTTRFVITNAGNVGIGTTTPTAKLQINGSGNTSATSSLLIQNSDAVPILNVRDDKLIQIADNATVLNFHRTTGTVSTSPRIRFTGANVGNMDVYGEQNRVVINGGGLLTTSGVDITGGSLSFGSQRGTASVPLITASNGMAGGIFFTGGSGVGGIAFSTNSTERVRIDTVGNVGIANTNPQLALHVGSTATTDATSLLRLQDANSTCDFTADTGSPSCGSDLTLKKDISSLDTVDLLTRISNLNPVSYRWNSQDSSAPAQFGFIAQEVETQFPDLVKMGTWGDGTQRKFLNTGGLMPYVIGAVKEQNTLIKALQTQTSVQAQVNDNGDLTTLEDRLAAAESKNTEQDSLLTQLQSTVTNLFKTATTFLADVTFKGRIWMSPDQTGSVTIPAGSTAVKVTFKNELPTTPLVHVTPQRALDKGFSVKEVSSTSFLIELPAIEAQDTTFTWLATLKDTSNPDEPTIEVINPASAPQPTLEPTVSPSHTPSASPSSDPPVATESGGTP